ncbi:MAG: hypothetical protein KKB59_18585 [Spirochaetes bacterium]|nr:hypothetical protein [Spirochaetota bacterium]
MSIIENGRIIDCLLVVGCFITFYYMTRIAQSGKKLKIRHIAGLDAIEDIIGRSIEMGRPVLFTSGGSGSLSSSVAPQLIAAVSVLSYVSKLTAKLDADLIAVEAHPGLLPMVDAAIQTQYILAGEKVPLGAVRYIPLGFSYTLGCSALIRREKPAAAILIGPFSHEAVFLAQACADVGAVQVAGTARTLQMPFMAIIADYPLIVEDVYAAGAYIEGTPESTGSLVGEDPWKMASVALTILVAILTTLNIPLLTNILGM